MQFHPLKTSRLALLMLILFGGLVLDGCRKPVAETPTWDSEWLVPLAHGNLTMSNLVGDSILVTDPDGSLRLVYRNTLYSFQLAKDYISIPDTSFKTAYSLDSLRLSDQAINYDLTLGQLARADTSGQGDLILALHGFLAPIPQFNNISGSDIPFDATSFFEVAELDSGFLDLTLTNGFPIPIEDLILRLKNQNNGAVVLQDTFATIPRNTSVTRTYNLAGKTVEGTLYADLVNLNTPGSGGTPVLIDTNDAIAVEMQVRDLKVISAKAIFPAQTLIDLQNEVTYDMGGPEFTYLKIRSGELRITAVNTIPDSMNLIYRIPYAQDPSGVPISIETKVPGATGGQATNIERTYDLSNYTIDLTGLSKQKINTFYNEFGLSIDSTGQVSDLSLEDSVSIFYGLFDIIPEYLKGYLGQQTVEIGPEVSPFSFFAPFISGTLEPEDVTVAFNVYNGVGASGEVDVDYIRARNPKSGTELDLTAPFIGQPLEVPRAFENPYRAGQQRFELTPQNSNIDQVLAILPGELEYALDFDLNPDGNYYNYQDFVDFNQELSISMDIDMPMSVKAENLLFRDVMDFTLAEEENIDRIGGGTLYIDISNRFPIEGTLQVRLQKPNGQLVDSMFVMPAMIKPGVPDPQDCFVQQAAETKLEIEASRERWQKWQSATKAVVLFTLNTDQPANCGDYAKLFSDYFLNVNLSARFVYGPPK